MRGFGKVWYENPLVREYVGCPAYPLNERSVGGYAVQRFERGVMLWIEQTGFYWEQGVVLVMFKDDMTFVRVSDMWRPGQPEPSPQVPPRGLYEPLERFGKIWREGAGVKDRLGWAIEPEKSGGTWSPDSLNALNGAAQGFQRGMMYWIPYKAGTPAYMEDRWIYVLTTVGPHYKWLAFPDTWRD
jgi:uncharacterized protein with LGFP repeats